MKAHPVRILVSGVGRSGTTLVYKQIARQLAQFHGDVNFRYEPYLWNIREALDRPNPFDMSQMSYPGLTAHTQTPLFLEGRDEAHDSFIDGLYRAASDETPDAVPDAYLVKVIRGGGRLRAFLKRFPDLKIVICLRNPVDTINSSLGMFSLFGEEFHTDDRHRLRKELAARGADVSALDAPRLSVEWYAAWWRSFTEEALSIAADHPRNVHLFRYEAFRHNPEAMTRAMLSFVGVLKPAALDNLNVTAGMTIKSRHLTLHDLHALSGDLRTYSKTVLKPLLGAQAAALERRRIMARHAGGAFRPPVAGSDLGRKSPIQLRDLILRGSYSPFMSLARHIEHPLSLPDLIARHHTGDVSRLQAPLAHAGEIRKDATFGVVVTCRNNVATIAGAILSCLNQTLPFDEIVVVDGGSSDRSVVLVRELAQRYRGVKLVEAPDESAALRRDLGVRTLTTDFCAHLDGGDLMWPTKNADEAAVVLADPGVIAFSDALSVGPDASVIDATDAYSGKTGAGALLALLSRRQTLPRDMTVARDLYLKAGGLGERSRFFADWTFAMRLAATGASWERGAGTAGTIRNRLQPAKSGKKERAQVDIAAASLLRSLNQTGSAPSDLLRAYSAALGPFGPSDIMDCIGKSMDAAVESDADAARMFAALAADHRGFAEEGGQDGFAEAFCRFAAG